MNKQISKIVINWAEGRDYFKFPLEMITIKEVNTWIQFMSSMMEKGGHCLKTNFTIFFEEGFEYTGRYEILNNDVCDLEAHVKRSLTYLCSEDNIFMNEEQLENVQVMYDLLF